MKNIQTVIVLDIETTSLDVSAGAIIELAGVKLALDARSSTASFKDSFHTLIKPRVPIEADAFEAHGISDTEALEKGKAPEAAFSEFRGFLGNHALAAHNGLFFDYLFLVNEFSRYGIAPAENRLLDTLPLARKHLQSGATSYRLGDLCLAYGIRHERAHRADSDAKATAELLRHIAERHDFDELWQQSGRYTLKSLSDIPAGFDLLGKAITEGRDLQIRYAGADAAPRDRWIRPLYFQLTRGGHRSVSAICGETNVTKQFRLDRIQSLIRLK
jgi:DNA polymerase III epsilon subunit-like protein